MCVELRKKFILIQMNQSQYIFVDLIFIHQIALNQSGGFLGVFLTQYNHQTYLASFINNRMIIIERGYSERIQFN